MTARWKLPQSNKAATGKLFRRTPFLKGDVPVQLGPQQDFWALQRTWPNPPPSVQGTFQNTVFQYANLSPPGDWNAANTMLRPPQVVWMTPRGVYNYFIQIQYTTQPLVDTTTYTHGAGENPIGILVGNPAYFYAIETTETDLMPGTSQIFDQVISRMKSLRPGKTWGFNMGDVPGTFQITYESYSYSSTRVGATPISTHGPPTTIGQTGSNRYAGINAHNTIICPDQGFTKKFLGPDFLHVYAGAPAYSYLPAGRVNLVYEDHTAVTPYQQFGGGSPSQDIGPSYPLLTNRANLTLSLAEAELKACFRNFIRYACFLWGTADSAGDAYGRQIATDLKDFGFQYMGYMVDLTVDSVWKAIAGHFNFDPATGKDLIPGS